MSRLTRTEERNKQKRILKRRTDRLKKTYKENTGKLLSNRMIAEKIHVPPATFTHWAAGTNSPQDQDKYEVVLQDLTWFQKVLDRGAVELPDAPLGGEIEPKKPEPLTQQTELPLTTALDVQVGGSHYKDSSIQPVQYADANNLTFLEGCIVKRVTRHNKPTGKGREDIEKLIHEAQLLLELRYGNDTPRLES